MANPVAAELDAALTLRRSGVAPKARRRALHRIEELLDESQELGSNGIDALDADLRLAELTRSSSQTLGHANRPSITSSVRRTRRQP